jgi:hypothetical protein
MLIGGRQKNKINSSVNICFHFSQKRKKKKEKRKKKKEKKGICFLAHDGALIFKVMFSSISQ